MQQKIVEKEHIPRVHRHGSNRAGAKAIFYRFLGNSVYESVVSVQIVMPFLSVRSRDNPEAPIGGRGTI